MLDEEEYGQVTLTEPFLDRHKYNQRGLAALAGIYLTGCSAFQFRASTGAFKMILRVVRKGRISTKSHKPKQINHLRRIARRFDSRRLHHS
jgi:hypothetical protein